LFLFRVSLYYSCVVSLKVSDVFDRSV
jgi:hypothetical protein